VDDTIKTALPVEPPRGNFPARVDEKGRLTLLAPFREYVENFGDKKVFVTSLDFRTVRIYPITVWKDNERLFEEYTEDPEAAEDVAFIANDNGADCEMDDKGRVLIPQELRRQLGIENQPVRLGCYQGAISVYSEEHYGERKRRAVEGLPEKVRALRKKGLK
jgi:MraZ protein